MLIPKGNNLGMQTSNNSSNLKPLLRLSQTLNDASTRLGRPKPTMEQVMLLLNTAIRTLDFSSPQWEVVSSLLLGSQTRASNSNSSSPPAPYYGSDAQYGQPPAPAGYPQGGVDPLAGQFGQMNLGSKPVSSANPFIAVLYHLNAAFGLVRPTHHKSHRDLP